MDVNRIVEYFASVTNASLFYVVWFVVSFEQKWLALNKIGRLTAMLLFCSKPGIRMPLRILPGSRFQLAIDRKSEP